MRTKGLMRRNPGAGGRVHFPRIMPKTSLTRGEGRRACSRYPLPRVRYLLSAAGVKRAGKLFEISLERSADDIWRWVQVSQQVKAEKKASSSVRM
ncbi:hypothetical protein AVEN_207956-1 [Araneus ventricosus]|uniref:Uncharacterized protein n=1 Tax=Araneus ventricosus TaxID=182803 RepID=A0A4Y2PAU8_ARAVE|nr:hypothetical protein AVEN_207956-1 [Araneus ventricosus]